jgi:hypothetical protein
MGKAKETITQKLDKAMRAARGKITFNIQPDDSPKATQAVLNLMQAQNVYEAAHRTKELNEELGIVLDRVRPNLDSTNMMKATQAVLNLVHAKAQAEAVPQSEKEPAKQID